MVAREYQKLDKSSYQSFILNYEGNHIDGQKRMNIKNVDTFLAQRDQIMGYHQRIIK